MQTGAVRLGNSQHVGRLDGQAWVVVHPCAVTKTLRRAELCTCRAITTQLGCALWQGQLSHSGVHPSHTHLLLLLTENLSPTTLLQGCWMCWRATGS